MGAQAVLYKRRKLATACGATDEFEFYNEPEPLYPLRPCWCEWNCMKARLLGQPEPQGYACACVGDVHFNVPGYTGRWGEGDEHRMRRFAQLREAT